jgi:hypothetical protein
LGRQSREYESKYPRSIENAMQTLREIVGQSIIVCYKEDVGQLERHLRVAGLNPLVQRATYTGEQLAYSANTRCLLNHSVAWQKAANFGGYTLIAEADFVPCVKLGVMPAFWPAGRELAWGYLYQGSPRILALVGSDGFIRGHCAPTVAYIINNRVAQLFLEFFEYEMAHYDPRSYYNFEAHLQWWTMGGGGEAYIPARHYGEHGGVANREHAVRGLPRGGSHRADNLAGRLAFLPHYASGSWRRFCIERAKARFLGGARLLSGRWIIDTNVYRRSWRDTAKMYKLGVSRLLF